jgi:DNA polymerase III alpha subunit
MGLTILPPDINISEWGYTGVGRSVRVGLMQIKSLHEDLASRIMLERQTNGPYRSLHDVLDLVKPEMAQAALLIKEHVGGVDTELRDLLGIGRDRDEMLGHSRQLF